MKSRWEYCVGIARTERIRATPPLGQSRVGVAGDGFFEVLVYEFRQLVRPDALRILRPEVDLTKIGKCRKRLEEIHPDPWSAMPLDSQETKGFV